MLQSEFFERTHITLTGEEYADVECLYNAVKMNKDEFCKRWVSEKKNPLFKELAEAFIIEESKYRDDVASLSRISESLRKEFDEFKKSKQKEIDNIQSFHSTLRDEFGKRIVRANCEGELRVEEVIEEEFGYGFLIKAKREAGIPLSDKEIDYMVGLL